MFENPYVCMWGLGEVKTRFYQFRYQGTFYQDAL